MRILVPGGKGRIQGNGEIAFAERPVFAVKADFSGITPVPDLEILSDLHGTIEIKGPLDKYRGRLTIANRAKGWQKAQASVVFRGNLENLELTTLLGRWLDGSVKGPLKISWAEGFSLQGNLQGRNLNPSPFYPDFKGEINLDLDGRLSWPKTGAPEAVFKANLLQSRLLDKKDLSGKIDGRWKENQLHFAHFRLTGKGFDFQGNGTLQERINLRGEVSDLSQLISQANGHISAAGWFRFQQDRLTGMLSAAGKKLGTQGMQAEDLRADFHLMEYGTGIPPVLSLQVRAGKIHTGSLDISSINLFAEGSPLFHRVQFDFASKPIQCSGNATGVFRRGSWAGTLEKLDGRDDGGPWVLQAPAQITLSTDRIQFSPLILKSSQGETLEAQAHLTLSPLLGILQARWQNIDLERANPWIPEGRLSGQSSGSLHARGQESGWEISGNSQLKGIFSHDRLSLEVPSGQVQFDWSPKGLRASTTLKINPGAILEAKISSPDGFQFDLPRQGRLEAKWNEVDLGLFHSFLPREVLLRGKNSGTLTGEWFPGSRFEAAAKTRGSSVEFQWNASAKPISISLNAAEAEFAWRDNALQGNLGLGIADHGTLKGTFLIPLSASFSPSFIPEGPLKISIQGDLQEYGLLSRLYPEWIQKSRGKAALDLQGEGTWVKPQLKGTVQISEFGFQLEAPGQDDPAGKFPSRMNFEVPHAKVIAEWGSRGFLAVLAAVVNRNGRIEGTLTSSEPPRSALPREGKIDLSWADFDLAFLQPFLPESLFLEGQAEGRMKGSLLPANRLDLAGGWKVSRGNLSWKGDKGIINAGISQGDLDFVWRGEGIQGEVSVALSDFGSLKGDFPSRPHSHPD